MIPVRDFVSTATLESPHSSSGDRGRVVLITAKRDLRFVDIPFIIP